MGKDTKIQWCNYTFNPWIGCTKVNEACDNCYAEVSMPSRSFGIKWGKGEKRKPTGSANWAQPVLWNLNAEKEGVRRRVFCGSLCDWLDPEVPIDWLSDLLKVIYATGSLDWLLLTKRPHLWRKRVSEVRDAMEPENPALSWVTQWLSGAPPKNVWIGWSAGTQKTFDAAAAEGFKIPATIRFVSAEPLLEMIDASAWLWGDDQRDGLPERDPLDWLIIGGESGANARECSTVWIHSLVDQCGEASVACFVKQLGAKPLYPAEYKGDVGQPMSLKDKKGGDISEWPIELRVREFPEK